MDLSPTGYTGWNSTRFKSLTLQIAPLHIGGLMEKYLWHEKPA